MCVLPNSYPPYHRPPSNYPNTSQHQSLLAYRCPGNETTTNSLLSLLLIYLQSHQDNRYKNNNNTYLIIVSNGWQPMVHHTCHFNDLTGTAQRAGHDRFRLCFFLSCANQLSLDNHPDLIACHVAGKKDPHALYDIPQIWLKNL